MSNPPTSVPAAEATHSLATREPHREMRQAESAHVAAPPGSAGSPRLQRAVALQRALGNQAILRLLNATRAADQPSLSTTSSAIAGIIQRTCGCGGTCVDCREERHIQPKLVVGRPDDEYEQEADRIADQVTAPEREEQSHISSVGSAGVPAVQAKAAPGALPTPLPGPQPQGGLGGGLVLPASARSFFEPRLGYDLAGVRAQVGADAAAAAGALGARAFTLGSDIVFGQGEYAPDTPAGRRLLAHELVHIGQQARLGGLRIQRITHGPSTPTNCHNWRIPLPPWIAGTIAHGQISAILGIPSHLIPRASKLFMGIPNPPEITPDGFADLWQRGPGAVAIAEIKSTATGDVVARTEAAHYVLRHTEWLTRAPWTAADDLLYAADVGASLGGSLLDLSSRTGTDLMLGPFWGDPLKQLHIEADALGAVLYWCTGAGLPASPLWLPAFREAVRRLKEELQKAKRTVQEVLEGIAQAARSAYRAVADLIGRLIDWAAEHSRLLAFLLIVVLCLVALVVLILSLLAEAPSGGTSTITAAASAAVLVVAFGSLMRLLGQDPQPLANATASVTAALAAGPADQPASGAEYEREAGLVLPPTTPAAAAALAPDPSALLTAAVSQLLDPMNVVRGATQIRTMVTPGDIAQLQSAVAALDQAGDSDTAATARRFMQATGLT